MARSDYRYSKQHALISKKPCGGIPTGPNLSATEMNAFVLPIAGTPDPATLDWT